MTLMLVGIVSATTQAKTIESIKHLTRLCPRRRIVITISYLTVSSATSRRGESIAVCDEASSPDINEAPQPAVKEP